MATDRAKRLPYICRWLLDSDMLVLLVCNTHVDPQIGAHEKIISLPLGVNLKHKLLQRLQKYAEVNRTRTKLLTINNSGIGDRAAINAQVSAAFNFTVFNSYKVKQDGIKDFYEETASSKFVLCPSGLGMDSYRIWESLLLGAIPIVESNAGSSWLYTI